MILCLNMSMRDEGWVCLSDDSGTLTRRLVIDRSTTDHLPVVISDMAREFQCAIQDIKGIGVVNGPGALTPLRLSLATVKTLAMLVGCPLFGYSVFEIMHDTRFQGVQIGIVDGRKGRCLVGGTYWNHGQVDPLFDTIEMDLAAVGTFLKRFTGPVRMMTSSPLMGDALRRLQVDQPILLYSPDAARVCRGIRDRVVMNEVAAPLKAIYAYSPVY